MPAKKTSESSSKAPVASKSPQPKTTAASPKAMDIHPAGTAPTVTTGRPVIVGNKSMASDPMLSVNKPQPTTSPTPTDDSTSVATTAPVVSRHAKTIAPLSATEAEAPLEQENDAVAKSVEAMTKEPATEETPEVADVATDADEPKPAAEETAVEAEANTKTDSSEETIKAEPETAPSSTETTETTETSPTPDITADTADESDVPASEEETAPQEKTAEQMREDQIEEIIQKKTYAVPIDKTGRRRHNAMLALLLVLVAAVVTINFLLDFGVITIPGAPSTDIFPPEAL